MADKQYNNEIIDFEADKPVSLTLLTNPLTATGKEYNGQNGPFKKYLYKCEGNKIFFATEKLHEELGKVNSQHVTINKKVTVLNNGRPGFVWEITGSGSPAPRPVQPASDGVSGLKLDMILSKLEGLENHIYGKAGQKGIQAKPTEEKDGDLAF